MLMNPTDEHGNASFEEILDEQELGLSSILEEAEIVEKKENKNSKGNSLSELLDKVDASLSDISKEVSNVLKNGSDDHIKLRAAELAAKMHGAMNDKSGALISPVINLSVHTSKSTENNLMNVLVPGE